jgi:hypothetical protein
MARDGANFFLLSTATAVVAMAPGPGSNSQSRPQRTAARHIRSFEPRGSNRKRQHYSSKVGRRTWKLTLGFRIMVMPELPVIFT